MPQVTQKFLNAVKSLLADIEAVRMSDHQFGPLETELVDPDGIDVDAGSYVTWPNLGISADLVGHCMKVEELL